MNLNPHLHEAVAIFKKLGWDKAELSEASTLPLGTPKQQKIARTGLATGDWGEDVLVEGEGWRWISAVDVNTKMLGLFATRVGVNARRALEVLPGDAEEEVKEAIAVIAQRGEAFATDFVCAVTLTDSPGWGGFYDFHRIAVHVALRMDLVFPRNKTFFTFWTQIVLGSFRASPAWKPQYLWHAWFDAEEHAAPAQLLQPTFIACVQEAARYPSMALCLAIVGAYHHGWMDRHNTVSYALSCIAGAHTLWERGRLARLLFLELGLSVDDLLPHLNKVEELIATGDPAMVSRFALSLMPHVTGQNFVDIVLPALNCRTAKTTVAVLNRLITLPAPDQDIISILIPHIEKLLSTGHHTTIKKATKLLKHWNQPVPEVQQCQRSYAWINPPQRWELPRFECGVASVEKLTHAVQTLEKRVLINRLSAFDLKLERFLALANDLARTDPDAAKALLSKTPIFNRICQIWALGPNPHLRITTNYLAELIERRVSELFAALGELPCLLSEPSFVDLSITACDFIARLQKYRDTGTPVLENDLLFALTRLNPDTFTEAAITQIEQLDVALRHVERIPAEYTVAQVVKEYLTVDISSDPNCGEGLSYWTSYIADLAKDFREPDEGQDPELWQLQFRLICEHPVTDLTVDLHQMAHHGKPLTPHGAMLVFDCQRPSMGGTAETRTLLNTIWQRGLLHPGVADPDSLSYSYSFERLKELAVVLDDAAHDGMLSVVWPLLDALIGFSLNQDQLLPGTTQIVNLIEHLAPTVKKAVANKTAPHNSFDLPNLHTLAKRPEKDKAITAARNALKTLGL